LARFGNGGERIAGLREKGLEITQKLRAKTALSR
jgi:hypothetical protein